VSARDGIHPRRPWLSCSGMLDLNELGSVECCGTVPNRVVPPSLPTSNCSVHIPTALTEGLATTTQDLSK